jgi:carbonic anhydrase
MLAPHAPIARRWRLLAACVLLWALDDRAAAADAPPQESKATAPKKGAEAATPSEAPAPRVAKAAAAEPEPKAHTKGHNQEKKEAPAARATAKAEATADRPSAKAEAQDPLDRLRERLAEKLGATPAAHPRVMRVAARSPEPPSASHAAPRPRGGHAATTGVAGAAGHAAQAHSSHAPHWDYKGDGGPESWGRLRAEFSQCATGARQSPIDIRDGVKVQLDPVQFDYRPSSFRVIDNGHTVQVNVAAGNSIEVIGRRYELQQFHFHRPSEERINGRQFDMVAHLVHKDPEGRLAVVAVLLDRGSAHAIVQTVWNNLPLEKGEEVPARSPLDLAALLPVDRSYYTYMGSLTTPPCSEGVLWMVMKNPVPISPEQIAVFSRLYPMNARPVQSASGRLIKESN